MPKLTGLMNSGWPGSDSCSFPSLVVLISSCPFGDVFSLLNHIANARAFVICFNGHLPSQICHAQKSCRNANLTGLTNTGWPGSDSCSYPSLVVLTSSCPFGDVFSLLNHIASARAFAICFNGRVPNVTCSKILQECDIDWPDELA